MIFSAERLNIGTNGNLIRMGTAGGPSRFMEQDDLKFLVRKAGTVGTVNMQLTNTNEKYLIGSYDVEIPTLPRLNLEKVKILQSHTTTIKIPRPGIATLQVSKEGVCGLFHENENGLTWIYNVDTRNRSESIVLLPGNYRAVYRPANAKRSHYTIENSFTIEAGKSIYVKIL